MPAIREMFLDECGPDAGKILRFQNPNPSFRIKIAFSLCPVVLREGLANCHDDCEAEQGCDRYKRHTRLTVS